MYAKRKYEAIVMGVSAGGSKALETILPMIPDDFCLPVVIVQHRKNSSNVFFIEYLNRMCNIPVKEVQIRESVEPGIVYLAPGGYHTLIEDDKTFTLSVEPPVHYSRPAIDILFESAVYVYEQRLIGVILTGANRDGAYGLKQIKEVGGITIVQHPESAEYKQMPLAAIEAVKVDYILGLDEIVPNLIQLIK
jgi:two-component system chemotaxis response regulator CheB